MITIAHGKLNIIANFGVFVLKDGRTISSCTGIRSAERCDAVASEYSRNWNNAPITTPFLTPSDPCIHGAP